MQLKKILGILFLHVFLVAYGQLTLDHLHHRSRVFGAHKYMNDSLMLHSSVLPLITKNDFQEIDSNLHFYLHKSFKKSNVCFYPITNLSLGIESSNKPFKYTAGIGAGFDFSSSKFYFTGKLMPYINNPFYLADSIQKNLNADLGTTRTITQNIFQQNEIYAVYQPHEIFTFIGGYGKSFFGEGYRSLLLSDNASNYPFLKIETAFGGIKYVNLFSVWNDNSINPYNKSLDQMKFSATHYLSWNITKEFNLSVFESVIWQAKDSLAFRGFDLNYLNPFVFYRPVEYANGSADNVLLGLNLSFKFNEHQNLYAQALIDEFLLSQLKSGNKWWGNKYAIQLGYKTNDFMNKKIYLQTEFNLARPFTYSHKYSVQNYGHLNASVTHPVGANYYEAVLINAYQTKKFQLYNKITMTGYGVSTDSVNVGQNIFLSYADRAGDYNHTILQGQHKNVFIEQFIIEYPLNKKINLMLFASYQLRVDWTQAQSITHHSFQLGIHSRIWNRYDDY